MIAFIGGFLVFLILLSYFQIRSILAKGNKKEACVYGFLMGLAAVIGSLLIAGVEIPSPNIVFTKIFEPIGKAVLGK